MLGYDVTLWIADPMLLFGYFGLGFIFIVLLFLAFSKVMFVVRIIKDRLIFGLGVLFMLIAVLIAVSGFIILFASSLFEYQFGFAFSELILLFSLFVLLVGLGLSLIDILSHSK